MSYKATQTGKRGIRVKKAAYKILDENRQGLSSNDLFTLLKETNVKKFINNPSQIAQVMRGMKGVVTEEGYAYASDGQRYKAKIFILKYPEDFLDWLGDD